MVVSVLSMLYLRPLLHNYLGSWLIGGIYLKDGFALQLLCWAATICGALPLVPDIIRIVLGMLQPHLPDYEHH